MWTSEHWSSAGGNVSVSMKKQFNGLYCFENLLASLCLSCLLCFNQGAVWDPHGRMILISFSESVTLASIHFSSRLPSLGNIYWLSFQHKFLDLLKSSTHEIIES